MSDLTAGELIRRQRLSLGMTQADLARETGMSSAMISAVESGTRSVTDKTRRIYARALGLLPESLILGGGETAAFDAWQQGYEAGRESARRALRTALAALEVDDHRRACPDCGRQANDGKPIHKRACSFAQPDQPTTTKGTEQ
ncbi:MAG TPA: helix-turn-helix transcriptional regulator [Solirubrobacterales bacterium]